LSTVRPTEEAFGPSLEPLARVPKWLGVSRVCPGIPALKAPFLATILQLPLKSAKISQPLATFPLAPVPRFTLQRCLLCRAMVPLAWKAGFAGVMPFLPHRLYLTLTTSLLSATIMSNLRKTLENIQLELGRCLSCLEFGLCIYCGRGLLGSGPMISNPSTVEGSVPHAQSAHNAHQKGKALLGGLGPKVFFEPSKRGKCIGPVHHLRKLPAGLVLGQAQTQACLPIPCDLRQSKSSGLHLTAHRQSPFQISHA
jgi:hypothetical protein